MLCCPVCHLALSQEKTRAVCPAGHSFDRAREGYLNLLLNSSSHGHGDDRAMLLARRAFLEKGHYQPLISCLCREVEERIPVCGSLLDAGCGEGYYTDGIFSYLKEKGKEIRMFGFDISKEALRLTAKKCAGKGSFFVASTFHIPVLNASADMILSLFAPYSEEEFLRVLKPGGVLIRAVPLEDHLFSFKQVLYENPTKNTSRAVIGEGFEVLSETRIRRPFFLSSSEEIMALFGMTPYAHKTSVRDREKLESLSSLATEMDLGVIVYRKKD